jgi:hypothetical protein
MQCDFNVGTYYYNRHGREVDPGEFDRMFGSRLTTGRLPWWVRQMYYRSAVPIFRANPMFYGVAVFKIDPRIHASAGAAS